jgi:hypothetical protein
MLGSFRKIGHQLKHPNGISFGKMGVECLVRLAKKAPESLGSAVWLRFANPARAEC